MVDARKDLNIIRDALTVMVCIKELADCVPPERNESNDNKKSKRGETVKRRARSLPSLVASAGLPSAITFIMSKSNANMYSQIYHYLKRCVEGIEGGCQTFASSKDLHDELTSEGRGGYSTIAAVTALELKKVIEELTGKSVDELDTLEKLAKTISKEVLGSDKEFVIERYMLEYLTEVKKLAEALF